MNVTVEGSGALSPMDLSLPRSKEIVIAFWGFWTVTALFCLQIGFTAYAQLRLPQVAEAFAHLGFPDYFRVELAWAKFLGVVLLLAPVPARLKEWAYAGFAITLGSALIAHLSVGDGPEAWGFAAGTGVLWGLSYFFWRRLQACLDEAPTERSRSLPRRSSEGAKSGRDGRVGPRSLRVLERLEGQFMPAKSPVAEVSVLPQDGVLVWPRMCCCCGNTIGLSSIEIYFRASSVGPNAIMHIPYCHRCMSHHGRASGRALASAGAVLAIGLTILSVSFFSGMLNDPFLAFFLQLLVVVGAVVWGVRTYSVARAEIRTGITPECSGAETPAVVIVTARPSGWRVRFYSRAYAEQFAAVNPGGSLTTLYLD